MGLPEIGIIVMAVSFVFLWAVIINPPTKLVHRMSGKTEKRTTTVPPADKNV